VIAPGQGTVGTTQLQNGLTVNFADGSAAAPSITNDGDTNTGIFFPAADTIAFAEGGVESMRLDSSANLQFNSGYGSVVTAYGCRAWVNFNGTGTVATRGSGNVSSITDNGTGDYTVNIDVDMPDANYSANLAAASSALGNNLCIRISGSTVSTSNVRVTIASGTGSLADCETVCVSVFR
jgi:hypothetical protein